MVKPNLLMKALPDKAVTIHPVYLEALATNIMNRGCEVVIAESSGGPYNQTYMNIIYKSTGISEVAKNTGAKLNTDFSHYELNVPEGVVCKMFDVITPVKDADIIVSAAKLKTHTLTYYSGAVKNMMGVIPGLTKPKMHLRYQDENSFCNMLIDLNVGIKPDICFIDGITGMEGNGPSGGTPRHSQVSICSLNPYNADVIGAKLLGYEKDDVTLLRLAKERDLCDDIKAIQVCGDDIELLIQNFTKPDTFNNTKIFKTFVPKGLARPLRNLITKKPKVNTKICVGCGECAMSCPSETIAIANKKAVINYKKCIRCYCCSEFCPIKAIYFN